MNDPLLLIPAAAIIGLVVGSFLNVVIHRLPIMLEREWKAQCAELAGEAPAAAERYDLVAPRSRCPACGHPIIALENIPLLSWIMLRGRCSACGVHISARYPLVEAAGGMLAALMAWRFGFTPAALLAMVFAWSMLALTCIDLDHQLLPDRITLPLLWLGLLANLWAVFTPLPAAVVGAAAGYLALWSVYWVFKLVTGKEGMGYGDFKLLAVIGAWLGWQMLPLVILLSSVVGAGVGIGLIVAARLGRSVPIPFGPYLAAAGVVAMLWGQDIMLAYLGS